ncbi:MAG: TIGR04255 family protein [Acidobacteriaceae bacterium]
MPLPPSKRVVFKRNPLFAVSAQMRFPPILRIQVEPPAQFQEAIRDQFPGYELVNPAQVAVPPGVPAEVQAAMRAAMQSTLNVSFEQAHRFKTDDGSWTLQLTQESLTMACKSYERWEVFREKFNFAREHFITVYKPPFSTMVGLRYQNAIDRSKLGLDGVGWKELLKPFIAAEFGCDGLSEQEIVANLHRFQFKDGSDDILVQHGMATHNETKVQVYSIDNNLNSTGKVELTDVLPRLDQLNKHSGSLFRLCITDRLYNSLDPISI